jgi:uncharacterized OB-fold protein
MRWFPDDMPLPAASRETLPWWEAAREHHLVVQACAACGATRHPPGPRCPACRSAEVEWCELSGRGTVYTFAVVHQPFIASLADVVPYVVAAVDLEGARGARLVSNVVDVDPAAVHIGMEVDVVWEDMSDELALPRFRPR